MFFDRRSFPPQELCGNTCQKRSGSSVPLRTSKSHPSSSTFRFEVTPTSSQNARVAYCRGGRVHSPLSIVLPVPNCFFAKPYTVQTTSTQPLHPKQNISSIHARMRRYARRGCKGERQGGDSAYQTIRAVTRCKDERQRDTKAIKYSQERPTAWRTPSCTAEGAVGSDQADGKERN